MKCKLIPLITCRKYHGCNNRYEDGLFLKKPPINSTKIFGIFQNVFYCNQVEDIVFVLRIDYTVVGKEEDDTPYMNVYNLVTCISTYKFLKII